MRMLNPILSERRLTSDIFNEMDRFFEDINGFASTWAYDDRNFAPACEVSEMDEHFLMSVDLPGMRKEDIKIELRDNVLSISGERKRESGSQGQKIQRYEKSYGFFKRSFTLPSSVDVEKVEAQYENGVLELYLPKQQSAKAKNIEIQTGKGGFFERLLGGKKQDLKDVSASKE